MKTIELTKGKKALVDDEDFAELSQHKWCVNIKNSHGKTYFYAVRNTYERGRLRPTLVYMHRVITAAPKGKLLVVDHVNGDTLDNRRSNLQIVDRATNKLNGEKAALCN